MSDQTTIEWTDATWNPVSGCTKVSDGCTHCYIARTPPFRMAHRRFQHPDPVDGTPDEIGATTGVRVHPERLTQPLVWRKPRRIFVCSLADLFHADVPDLHIARTFATMHLAGQHTFQVLTKRPARMRSLLTSHDFILAVEAAARTQAQPGTMPAGPLPWPLPNVWVGVSAETQQWADVRVRVLQAVPAAVRWVSAEPLLGPLNLAAAGAFPGVDWVVAGGESGPGARPMHPEWARDLRDHCAAAGVAFLFKQWGEHDGSLRRVGKKAAGRELDGLTHDEYPGGAS